MHKIEINPTHIYSKNEIVTKKLIPWAHNETTVKRILDKLSKSTQQDSEISAHGNRYFILGKHLQSYLNKYDK